MIEAVYGSVVERFAAFEPLASGFIPDRIRTSILLRFGEAADALSRLGTLRAGTTHELLGHTRLARVRGLNPGIAFGQLVVVTDPSEPLELSPDKIYVMSRVPEDLRPVAGIATLRDGNVVSHVQLLARNLGIPNAVVSRTELEALSRHSGEFIFYAVSPGGAVVMKLRDEMSDEERQIVKASRVLDERVTIPVDRVDLANNDLIPLSAVRSSDSGVICGPKAANLGQLSVLFPDRVMPGLVIPFGVFYQHLQQRMPGKGISYREAIQDLFERSSGRTDPELFARLAEVRDAIRKISFLPGFEKQLSERFREIFQADAGERGVFVRSDTNMEDLADFTGAGLNLTVPNVKGKNAILQAIRDVWASPFSERSYRWRRRVLTNPDAVYPSVLLLPTVRVDKSGVLITTGIETSNPEDLTVAFDWGGGGAVGGQAAETYVLGKDGRDELIAPAREPLAHVLLERSGIESVPVHFDRPILTETERAWIRRLAETLKRRLSRVPGLESGPFDVELGFWNETPWLFQVRPFVENEHARSSSYLRRLDRAPPTGRISLAEPLTGLVPD